ncbi:MAG: glycosyltransferase [Opitutaceae bacterium]|jgi:glycosyltransferase involved in cell wall biosynthesis|nr:glycosyltransferase [Opitutaceae bacterium]
MILFDITKSSQTAHHSGIQRVNRRLLAELGAEARPVIWRAGRWRHPGWRAPSADIAAQDWLLTTELFCEEERPGFTRFLDARPCRLAALFHDAIPLKHPAITWPQSVARHPAYMTMLADFDRVLAVSEWSRNELTTFWQWQGRPARAEVRAITLGADFLPDTTTTATTPPPPPSPPPPAPRPRPRETNAPPGGGDAAAPARLLCVGILEPRKNQAFLLDVCAGLWAAGLAFELHIAGRVNPHFGGEIERKLLAMQKTQPGIRYHRAPDDAMLLGLLRAARAAVFPTIAEGCGLPPLEALRLGVPCVCSDLPVLREHALGGGCVAAAPGDRDAWTAALRRILTDDAWHAELRAQAATRNLPAWSDTAAQIRAILRG